MSRDVFTWYVKECQLEMKQCPILVGDLPKKVTTRENIEPLNFQKVELESEQVKVTRFEYLVVSFGIEKY